MNRRILFLLPLLVFLVVPTPAGADVKKDEKLGYRIVVPRGWNEIPVKNSEKWIVGKWLSKKEYIGKDDVGMASTFKPHMQVIIFPDAVTKKRVSEEKIEVGGHEITFRNLKNPYKNYKDYLKRTYSGGGWYESLREEKTKKDLKWTLVEVKVEKLTWGGKKRLIAGIFHADDADYVVQFEILEDSYKKLRNTVYASLNSFQFIARKGSIAPETTGDTVRRTDESKMTPGERKKLRLGKQKRAYEKAVSKLPKGWTHFKYKDYFYVLSHVDKKYAAMVCKHGEAVWKWVDKKFGFLGKETVRPIIIRICANREEESAYHGTGSGGFFFFSSGSEVVLSKGDGIGFGGSPFSELNSRIFSNYLRDKDRNLTWSMPSWIRWGMETVIDGAWTKKNGQLYFRPSTWNAIGVAEAKRDRALAPIQKLLSSTRKDIGNTYSAQTGALCRFLLLGPGSRMKGGKDFIERYLIASREYAKEQEEKRDKEWKERIESERPSEDDGPKTEEEEDEEFKKRRQAARSDWEAEEAEHNKAILEKAFGDWKESRWKSLNNAFRGFVFRK